MREETSCRPAGSWDAEAQLAYDRSHSTGYLPTVPHVQFWESNKLPDSAKAVLVATCTMVTASQVHLSEQQFALIARALAEPRPIADPSRAATDNWPQKSRRPLTEVLSFA